MGQDSKIQWTHHTFNPWRGCTKVSDGCKFCYADKLSGRNPKTLGIWGKNGTRVVAAESYWREPLKWNAAAEKAGERHRVFCASLADVFEGEDTMPLGYYGVIRNARVRLFQLIEQTPHLDWLLLTKRPENILNQVDEVYTKCLVQPSRWPLPNVWLGTSVENQQTADERIPHLLRVPAAVRFLSMEPLIGDVWLSDDALHGQWCVNESNERVRGPRINWVIAGGESGPGARPCNVEWIRSIVQQCRAAGVACFVKQLGARPETTLASRSEWPGHRDKCHQFEDAGETSGCYMRLTDPKGGDPDEWPADLRVRELPG